MTVLRVATYNIHGAVGTDGRYDPMRIVSVIRAIDPDILALQEVDTRRPRHGGLDQFELIAAETGLTGVPGGNVRDHTGEFGNALFTRFRVGSSRRIDLSVDRREPRSALDIALETPWGEIRAVATHLGLRGAERRIQIDRLIGGLGEAEGRTLLLGDLNEWLPGSNPRLRRLTGRFPEGWYGRTWPSRRPIFALDRIYATPKPERAQSLVWRTEGARRASDHLPFVVTLEW